MPRATIKTQQRASFSVGAGAHWERIAEPSRYATHRWAQDAQSLRTLMTGEEPPRCSVGVFCCVDLDRGLFHRRRGVDLTFYDDFEALLAAAPDQILLIGGPGAFYDHVEERMRAHGCRRRVLIIARPENVTLDHLAAGALTARGTWSADLDCLLQQAGVDT